MKFIKITSFFLLALISLMLVACGGNNEGKENTEINYDLEFDENGEFTVDYLENITLNVWSVIGDPDKTVLNDMILRFNNEYEGMIRVNITTIGEGDYYAALDNEYANNFKDFPDICIMHNEMNIEYASKDYFRNVDEMIDLTKVDFSFDEAYDNIERTTLSNGSHYGIPIDAHGYLMQIRQDIIKKNGLGFDNNTRFTPNSYEEYLSLLQSLRALADSGELWTRSINKQSDHSWYQLKNGNSKLSDAVTSEGVYGFYPAFLHEQEQDLLTALYVNGGTLLDQNGKVNFQNCTGFKNYITDFVNRKHAKLYGDAYGQKEAAFGSGRIAMFSEGPWQTAGIYDYMWNNSELKQAGNGVTAEDAADPIYRDPLTVCRSYWAAQPGATGENVSKYYGLGHVITLTKKMTSQKQIAAALVFAEWLTQGKNGKGEYNLVEWCKSGHIPAWKNVYNSAEYKAAQEASLTLAALGDPAEIISLESSPYASTLIAGLTGAYGIIVGKILSVEDCTVEEAMAIIQSTANSTQEILDILNLKF